MGSTFDGLCSAWRWSRRVSLAVGVVMLSCAVPETGAREWGVMLVLIGFPYLLPFRLAARFLRRCQASRAQSSVFTVRIAEDGDRPVDWADEPATDRQLGFIRHLGGDPAPGITKAAASDMIDYLLAAKDARPSTISPTAGAVPGITTQPTTHASDGK